VAKWVAFHLPYSVVCWVLVRDTKYANERAGIDAHRSWGKIMDIWEEQEGTKPWERS
jgi:hypothetical protein